MKRHFITRWVAEVSNTRFSVIALADILSVLLYLVIKFLIIMLLVHQPTVDLMSEP